MKESITATIRFSFKGEEHAPSMVIDLDDYLQQHGDFDAIYQLLAQQHQLDLYSYEYEMMQAEELQFSAATGVASRYLDSCSFDLSAYQQAIEEARTVAAMAGVAREYLAIADLSNTPDLKAALLQAFKLGQQSSSGSRR